MYIALTTYLLFSSTYRLVESLGTVTVEFGMVTDDLRTDKVEKGGLFLQGNGQPPTGQERANDL